MTEVIADVDVRGDAVDSSRLDRSLDGVVLRNRDFPLTRGRSRHGRSLLGTGRGHIDILSECRARGYVTVLSPPGGELLPT